MRRQGAPGVRAGGNRHDSALPDVALQMYVQIRGGSGAERGQDEIAAEGIQGIERSPGLAGSQLECQQTGQGCHARQRVLSLVETVRAGREANRG